MIQKKTVKALDIAVFITSRAVVKPVTTEEIANGLGLSSSYTESILKELREADLIRAHRGPGGGYTIARDLDKVSVAEIVTAVDETLDATQCGGKEDCLGDKRCMTHDLWSTLNKKMYVYLDSVKLSDLVEKQRAREVHQVKVLQDKRPVIDSIARPAKPVPATA